MGDQRFHQLLNALGKAYASADAGSEQRKVAREREQQRAQWLAEREAAILEIVDLMHRHKLGLDDLA